MNIIDKVVCFIRKVWSKQDIKTIEAPKQVKYKEPENVLDKYVKVTLPTTPESKKKKVETLTFSGDGLGIQKDIHY